MDLKITGEVTSVLEEETGKGRNGTWRKQSFILKTPGDYPKEVCVIQWGDSIDKFPVKSGETITAHIDIQSREYNGRWYTDVKAWKIEGTGGAAKSTKDDEPPLPEDSGGFEGEDDSPPF